MKTISLAILLVFSLHLLCVNGGRFRKPSTALVDLMLRCDWYETAEFENNHYIDVKTITRGLEYSSNDFKLKLYVLGDSDVNIFLSHDQNGDYGYDFVIGADWNGFVAVRRYEPGQSRVDIIKQDYKGILKGDEVQKVKIQITRDGIVRLQIDDEAIGKAKETTVIPINYIYFYRYGGVNATNNYFYNCKELETLL